ncbi:Detected protein of confused Function [Hibiscus syriacus]|uniref:Detected protein of confused Function n=1 Tax=Hibiscus syriacus TaxID=106335 RepID=A0A6A2WVD6_HIBSY|nr:Detected protein of confused Function [Hibiscus syriacus]
MENLMGLLRIHVNRGVNLAVKDVVSSDPHVVIKMGKQVISGDTFVDDKMGDAEFEIMSFLIAVKMRLQDLNDGTIISKVQPSRQNCLSQESCIVWSKGKIVQDMFLRLRNVETGEVELRLERIDVPGSRGI